MTPDRITPAARVEVLVHALPGRAVAGVAILDGVVWVVVDPHKPLAQWHASDLVDSIRLPAGLLDLFHALISGLTQRDGERFPEHEP